MISAFHYVVLFVGTLVHSGIRNKGTVRSYYHHGSC